MTLYLLTGAVTGQPMTYRGRLLIHDNRAEVEYLIPGQRTVEVPGADLTDVVVRYGMPAMWLKDHPDMAAVRWPLHREDFL